MKNWIVFFSQSGSEIANLIGMLKRCPRYILTNKTREECEDLDLYKMLGDRFIFLPKNPTVEDYTGVIESLNITKENSIITLHGYLRILPEEICGLEIYNLHPGLITKYPELKGKDPQKKAFKYDYDEIGCVIHKVIPEVDSGEILAEESMFRFAPGEDHVFTVLSMIAGSMWFNFLKDKI